MAEDIRHIVSRLSRERELGAEEYRALLVCRDEEAVAMLHEAARETAVRCFGRKIYIRGLIEFTNICRNDCCYCGIRKSNTHVSRYCLSKEEILNCCREGHRLGFRTFVLQGGELPDSADSMIEEVCAAIHSEFPDCAITLSVGERREESYRRFFAAGASRYLLRHETRNPSHYSRLHPSSMSLDNRLRCLEHLKDIGYQTGTGIMVGSPYQSIENIVEDILFIRKFRPEMIGLGPFIPHKDTPFGQDKILPMFGQDRSIPVFGSERSVDLTLRLISIFRLMFPNALIPATTALASLPMNGLSTVLAEGRTSVHGGAAVSDISEQSTVSGIPEGTTISGRELGILAGANVVMPNLSPAGVRGSYSLYDGKASSGSESAEGLAQLRKALEGIGYDVTVDRGDYFRE